MRYVESVPGPGQYTLPSGVGKQWLSSKATTPAAAFSKDGIRLRPKVSPGTASVRLLLHVLLVVHGSGAADDGLQAEASCVVPPTHAASHCTATAQPTITKPTPLEGEHCADRHILRS